jgi:VCBS repeat-containing protein
VVSGTYGALTISSNGAWSYALDTTKAAFMTLAAGQQVVEDFTYTAKNALGSSSARIIITIEGRDEPSPPVLAADSGSVTEDSGMAATGNLLGNDGGSPLSVGKVNATSVAATGLTAVAGLYGTLTIAADGTYSYSLKDSLDAVDILKAGQTLQETFTYEVTNQYGTDTDTLTIRINGANDAMRTINGTGRSESVVGSVNDDTIMAGLGSDTVNGRDGNDTIHGEAGKDRLYGGTGNDIIDGGLDADMIYGGDGNDRVVGGIGKDTLFGDEGDDYLDGGLGPNKLYGGNGNDTLVGGESGKDALYGEEGNDRVFGGAGADTLYGGNGNDVMVGGLGADKMFGGAGNDIFVFTQEYARDIIYDYVDGFDQLSLSGTNLDFGKLVISQSGANAIITSSDGSLYVSIIGAGGMIDATDFVDANDFLLA